MTGAATDDSPEILGDRHQRFEQLSWPLKCLLPRGEALDESRVHLDLRDY
jgi:hypothetical protein